MSFKACANSMFPFDLLDGPGAEVSERCWWVAYTMVRQEKRLAEDLTRRRIPFYLPLVAREHIYRGRRLQAEIPLFGSYLFLFADAAERLQGLATDRIAQLLPVNDGLKLYEDLRQVRRLIESKMPLTVEARLSPGQRVRVKHGSMAGLEGVVECRRQRTKLIIAVTFLQRGLSVEIEDLMLEPIDGHVSPRPVGAAMC